MGVSRKHGTPVRNELAGTCSSTSDRASLERIPMSTTTTNAEKSEESNGKVDARVGRALSKFLHAEEGQHGDETYRVHSGSGEVYPVDLDSPDGFFCGCPDPADVCKHIHHVLLFERPGFLLECEHGSERCPGVDAISFEEDEPTSEGNFPCFKCFMEAYRKHENTESEEEDTTETETGATGTNQPVMADGGQELTQLKPGQIVEDKTGTRWEIAQRVEQVDFAGDGTTVPCVRLEEVDGDSQEWIGCEKFPELVNKPSGRYSLVSEGDR